MSNQREYEKLRTLRETTERKQVSRKIVETILTNLQGRQGFDGWYDEIDPATRALITVDLEDQVEWLLEGQSNDSA